MVFCILVVPQSGLSLCIQSKKGGACAFRTIQKSTYDAVVVGELQAILHVCLDAFKVNEDVIKISDEEEEHRHALPAWNRIAMTGRRPDQLKISLRRSQIFLVASLLTN